MNNWDAAVSSLTQHEFEQIRTLAYQQFGLDLPDAKKQLVSTRLGKKIRELNLRSFQDYYQHVVEDRTGAALTSMIDALTTNHTSFFREPAHFEFLRQTILPSLRTRNRIEIWSAACSTGEEPYSLAFSLFDELGPDSFSKVRILATDISTRVLESGQKALYPDERCQGLSPEQLPRYLLRGEGKWKDWYLVKKNLRASVEFRRLNLMEPLSQVGAFPLILCRNVMIYFDRPTQEALVNRLAACLEPGGYLFVGHSESLSGLEQPLKYVQPAVYRKPDKSVLITPSSGGRK